jgi:hypothetical protein
VIWNQSSQCSAWVQIQREVPYVVAAIGQKRHLLVGLHPLQGVPAVGAQLAPLSAWAVLALASSDVAFLKHIAGLLPDPDRSRARSRLKARGLLELLPRLRERATCRGFLNGAEQLVDTLADSRLVLGGSSAARLPEWDLPMGLGPSRHTYQSGRSPASSSALASSVTSNNQICCSEPSRSPGRFQPTRVSPPASSPHST